MYYLYFQRLNDASATVGSIVEALSGNTESAPPTGRLCFKHVYYETKYLQLDFFSSCVFRNIIRIYNIYI